MNEHYKPNTDPEEAGGVLITGILFILFALGVIALFYWMWSLVK